MNLEPRSFTPHLPFAKLKRSYSEPPPPTTPPPQMNLTFSKVYLLDKNIGGANFILLMLTKISF